MDSSIGYKEFAEENYGIGLDDVDNFAREDCRHYHSRAIRFIRNHRQLNDEEILMYVRVLRRASVLGMDVSGESEALL